MVVSTGKVPPLAEPDAVERACADFAAKIEVSEVDIAVNLGTLCV